MKKLPKYKDVELALRDAPDDILAHLKAQCLRRAKHDTSMASHLSRLMARRARERRRGVSVSV